MEKGKKVRCATSDLQRPETKTRNTGKGKAILRATTDQADVRLEKKKSP